MNGPVDEWVRKAEADARSAEHELLGSPPNLDAVCFFAQQAVEKYLKALLLAKALTFPKTHDLEILADMAAGHVSCVANDREDLEWLADTGIEVRYPGEDATREDAGRALDIMRRWSARLRGALGLPE